MGSRQEMMQALNVGGMAKADIGDHSGYELRCALPVVEPCRSTRAKAAEPASQFLASVWAIRNQKNRAVARHGCCVEPTNTFRSKTASDFIVGRNLPVFGKALIVPASGLALAGHRPTTLKVW